MVGYDESIEVKMLRLYESLNEKDRRRYAAVEADKLGYGGTEYIASLFDCDPKTIRRGRDEVEDLPADAAPRRIRKKGGAAEMLAFHSLASSKPLRRKLPRTRRGRP